MYMHLEERKMYMHLEERKIYIYRYTWRKRCRYIQLQGIWIIPNPLALIRTGIEGIEGMVQGGSSIACESRGRHAMPVL